VAGESGREKWVGLQVAFSIASVSYAGTCAASQIEIVKSRNKDAEA
jgi:hypothetical protein